MVNILIPNTYSRASLVTAEEVLVFDLEKSDLDTLATGSNGANVSINFKLLEEFNPSAAFKLELRKVDENGELVSEVSSGQDPQFFQHGELAVNVNIFDNAKYVLVVKSSDEASFSASQFEVYFDEVPTFGGDVADPSVSSASVYAQEDAYVGENLSNKVKFSSLSDKAAYSLDLAAAEASRDIDISYSGPVTKLEIFKVLDSQTTNSKNITNSLGSVSAIQDIGIKYTVSLSASNEISILREDGTAFTATLSLGENTGVDAVPDSVNGTVASGSSASSAKFLAVSGTTAVGDKIILSIEADNEPTVVRTFTASSELTVDKWAKALAELFAQDTISFSVNENAETVKIVFSEPEKIGSYDFAISAQDTLNQTSIEKAASELTLLEAQSTSPILRIGDIASGDFKVNEKVGSVTTTTTSFSENVTYNLSDFIKIDGDYDAVYLSLEKTDVGINTPSLTLKLLSGSDVVVSSDASVPTILSKADFLGASLTAGSKNVEDFELLMFARKLTGQNKASDYAVDNQISDWFKTNPDQSDSSAILAAEISFIDTSLTAEILDENSASLAGGGSLLEGKTGKIKLDLSNFVKAENGSSDLKVKLSVLTEDISFVDPAVSLSKSKTVTLDAASKVIDFWVVKDSDLKALEDVEILMELDGASNAYGQKLDSLVIKPASFNVSELIPSLTTSLSEANALQPGGVSPFKYKVALDNYSSLDPDDSLEILLKPIASTNSSSFQIEDYELKYDTVSENLTLTSKSDLTVGFSATFSLNGGSFQGVASTGIIAGSDIAGKAVNLLLTASGAATSVYAFTAPTALDSSSDWTSALSDAFSGFKFEPITNENYSEIEISILSNAGTDASKLTSILDHQLTYNGKTFDSSELSIPNVQVITNLAINEMWEPTGTDTADIFSLNVNSADIAAGSGNDQLKVDSLPTLKPSKFNGESGSDNITFLQTISNYEIGTGEAGGIKITDKNSSGVLTALAVESLSFNGVSYYLSAVDGTASSYSGISGNNIFIVSSGSSVIVGDSSTSFKDIVVASTSLDLNKYSFVDEVYLSGTADLSVKLDGVAEATGNSGDNYFTGSSNDDFVYESEGADYFIDSSQSDADTFILSDKQSDYVFYTANDKKFIVGTSNTTVLDGVEKIAFSMQVNSTISIDDVADSASVSDEAISGITVAVEGDYTEGLAVTAKFLKGVSTQVLEGSESFKWYSEGSDLSIGDGASFTFTDAHINKNIFVRATYLDNTGIVRSVASTAKTASFLDDPSDAVIALSGSTSVGSKISATVLKFSDLDFDSSTLPSISSYQWLADGTEIVGETAQTLSITQVLSNAKLSVKLGFINKYGVEEFIESNDSSLLFSGRDIAPIAISSNDLFSIQSAKSSIDATSGTVKSEFENFFDGEETALFSDKIIELGSSSGKFDALTLKASTTQSVISTSSGTQKFSLAGNELVSQEKALFIDMSTAAKGATVNVSSLTSLAIKGPVNLTSDDRSQNVFAGKSDQNITTGAGNDFIASGAGDDTISSGRGIDRISAGAGDDTVHVDYVYDDSYISYDASNKQFIFDNGTDALTVNDAEKFIFTGSVEKNLTDLAVIGTKNFDPMGSIEVAGILNVGQTLTLKSSVTDSNGIDDDTIVYQWYRGDDSISDATGASYTLTDTDFGKEISVKQSYQDSLLKNSEFKSIKSQAVGASYLEKIGTSVDDTFSSTDKSELFSGLSGKDIFNFVKGETAQGNDIINAFDAGDDKIVFNGYTHSMIKRTLDANGDDYFVFTEDGLSSDLTLKSNNNPTSLKISNHISDKLKLSDTVEIDLDGVGAFNVNATVDFEKVTLSNEIQDVFKTKIKKVGDVSPSDPINLSDVLAQLKHIIGLRELDGNAKAAGDTNNDGSVNLSDVLDNLKHIIGLRPINSFDLVSHNGFAINSLTNESVGDLTMVINGDADQSHTDWDFV